MSTLHLKPSELDAIARVTADKADFEVWCAKEGLPVTPAQEMECWDGRFPATYMNPNTETSWRAWANKPARAQPVAAIPEATGELSDQDIESIMEGLNMAFSQDEADQMIRFARAILEAVLLAAIPEAGQSVPEALEHAATLCDDLHHNWRWDDEPDSDSGPRSCARAIRAVIASMSADASPQNKEST